MNNNRRNRFYEKPQWEVEKERLEQEKAEQDARNMEQTEENFPSLVSSRPVLSTWSGRKFNELASEWKADEDERKVIQEASKTSGDTTTPVVDGFVMPTFKLTHHYAEKEETVVSDDKPAEKEEDEWVTVDHRAKDRARQIRKQQRFEEKMRRMDNGEESESEHDDNNDDQADDSCWNDAPIGKSFNS